MQITAFADHYPLLLESDRLSLSTEFVMYKSVLLDRALAARHRLEPQAVPLVRSLQAGIYLSHLEEQAKELGVSPRQLDEIIGFLNFVGALRCRRSSIKLLHVVYTHMHGLAINVRYSSLAWRGAISGPQITIGLLRATWPILLLAPVSATLVALAGILPPNLAIVSTIFWIETFLVSMYLHELTHIYVIHWSGMPCSLFQRGLRFGLVHQRLSPHVEIVSSIAGPAIGVVFCSFCGLGAYLLQETLLTYLAGIIGFCHLLGLLPWYGDGRSLYTSLGRIRSIS